MLDQRFFFETLLIILLLIILFSITIWKALFFLAIRVWFFIRTTTPEKQDWWRSVLVAWFTSKDQLMYSSVQLFPPFRIAEPPFYPYSSTGWCPIAWHVHVTHSICISVIPPSFYPIQFIFAIQLFNLWKSFNHNAFYMDKESGHVRA